MTDNQDSAPPEAALDRVRTRPGGRSGRIREHVLAAAREELLEAGYASLSHRSVARRASVDPATVYRRWPTRARLAADALLDIAGDAVPIPDTGGLADDLEEFVVMIAAALTDPPLLRLFRNLSAANAEDDPDLREILGRFWRSRFDAAEAMITRAVERGEARAGTDAHALVEHLVAPVYLRALLTGAPIDEQFLRNCVHCVLVLAASR